MNALELYYVRPVWTGQALSNLLFCDVSVLLIVFRIKEKLRSGEMVVSGDQWPIFLYHGYSYDPDDPWNGLFRCGLLVKVGHHAKRLIVG
jgi:hypothetical protein